MLRDISYALSRYATAGVHSTSIIPNHCRPGEDSNKAKIATELRVSSYKISDRLSTDPHPELMSNQMDSDRGTLSIDFGPYPNMESRPRFFEGAKFKPAEMRIVCEQKQPLGVSI